MLSRNGRGGSLRRSRDPSGVRGRLCWLAPGGGELGHRLQRPLGGGVRLPENLRPGLESAAHQRLGRGELAPALVQVYTRTDATSRFCSPSLGTRTASASRYARSDSSSFPASLDTVAMLASVRPTGSASGPRALRRAASTRSSILR